MLIYKQITSIISLKIFYNCVIAYFCNYKLKHHHVIPRNKIRPVSGQALPNPVTLKLVLHSEVVHLSTSSQFQEAVSVYTTQTRITCMINVTFTDRNCIPKTSRRCIHPSKRLLGMRLHEPHIMDNASQKEIPKLQSLRVTSGTVMTNYEYKTTSTVQLPTKAAPSLLLS